MEREKESEKKKNMKPMAKGNFVIWTTFHYGEDKT